MSLYLGEQKISDVTLSSTSPSSTTSDPSLPYVDTLLSNLKINTLTKSQYQTLVSNQEINTNQLYFITDEVNYLTKQIFDIYINPQDWVTSSDSTYPDIQYIHTTVQVPGILATDNPIIAPKISSLDQHNAWAAVSTAETADNSITFKIYDINSEPTMVLFASVMVLR